MIRLKQAVKSGIRKLNSYPRIKNIVRALMAVLPSAKIRYFLRPKIEREWDEEIFQSRLGRFTFYYPSRNEIGLYASEFGIWDDLTPLFKRFIKSPRLVIEVGAHIGIDTLTIAGIVPKSCRIIVFEPADKYRLVLEKNIAANRLNNVEIYKHFVSSIGGKPELLHINLTSASVVPNASKSFPTIESQQVLTITLDEFTRMHPLEGLDLLKIDTDGSDQDVIDGAREVIKKFRPYLFVEFSGYHLERAKKDASNLSLARLLYELGYSKFIMLNKQKKPYTEFDDYRKLIQSSDSRGSFDVFAIPKEKAV